MSVLPEFPEPDGELTIVVIGREVQIDAFRASTMREYGELCRKAALDEVDEVCSKIASIGTAWECVDAIKDLK